MKLVSLAALLLCLLPVPALAQAAPTPIPTSNPLNVFPSNIIPTTTTQATFGGTVNYTFPAANNLVVTNWHEFRLSAYSGCGLTDATTVLNAVIAAAETYQNSSNNSGSKVIIDCSLTVSGVISLPTNLRNFIFDGQENQITIAATYNGDVFQLLTSPTVAQNNHNLVFENMNIAPSAPMTSGAIFNIGNCDSCVFSNIVLGAAVSGATANDLFDLGSPGLVNYFNRSVLQNIATRSGGGVHGAAFHLYGQGGNVVIENVILACDSSTGSFGFLANDADAQASTYHASNSIYPNWDVYQLKYVDFEQCGRGISMQTETGLANDLFFNDVIVDTTRGGSSMSFVSGNTGVIRRVRIWDPWLAYGVTGGAEAALTLKNDTTVNTGAGGRGVYDVQVHGGHFSANGSSGGNGISIIHGTGVTTLVQGTLIDGVQAYNATAGDGIYDDGADTTIEGSQLGDTNGLIGGTLNAYQPNNYGIEVASDAYGGNYNGNDLRNNTTSAAYFHGNAGTNETITYINNVETGYTNNNPNTIGANTSITQFGNYGDYYVTSGYVSGTYCSLWGAQNSGNPEACIDRSGDMGLNGNLTSAGNVTGTTSVVAKRLNQTSGNSWAFKGTLSSGVYTASFPSAYTQQPICVATEEQNTSHSINITSLSTTSITVTSSVTTGNADAVDIACFGNPN